MPKSEETLEEVLERARACDICAEYLPLGPRPVVRAQTSARLLIIGQAPGTKVHETGIPWNDPSGDRLRGWLGIDTETFYDESKIAIVPSGFCYPGRLPKGGDAPPRPECAPQWHAAIIEQLKNIELTLLVGMYAQALYLPHLKKQSLTETVAGWRDHWPTVLPTPHPSWRTAHWEKKNPWFTNDLLPELRRRIAAMMTNT